MWFRHPTENYWQSNKIIEAQLLHIYENTYGKQKHHDNKHPQKDVHMHAHKMLKHFNVLFS